MTEDEELEELTSRFYVLFIIYTWFSYIKSSNIESPQPVRGFHFLDNIGAIRPTDMYMKFKVKLAPIDLIACALYTKQHYFVYPSLMRKQTIVDRANHMA